MLRRIGRRNASFGIAGVCGLALAVWLVLLMLGGGEHPQHAAASQAPPAATEHLHAGPAGSVADRLAADPDAVGFCVSASLEPFSGALAQIREIGPAEATERFHRCLLDTLLDHADAQTLTELETHREHFLRCYAALPERDDREKEAAVAGTLTCVQRTTS